MMVTEEGKSSQLMQKPLYKTLVYYAAVIVIVALVNILPGFKSGPCTPNLDFFIPILAFLCSIVLCVINGVRLMMYSSKKQSPINNPVGPCVPELYI